jgi:hypothetical protein
MSVSQFRRSVALSTLAEGLQAMLAMRLSVAVERISWMTISLFQFLSRLWSAI